MLRYIVKKAIIPSKATEDTNHENWLCYAKTRLKERRLQFILVDIRRRDWYLTVVTVISVIEDASKPFPYSAIVGAVPPTYPIRQVSWELKLRR
jgi:hypothetical protein